MSDHKREIDELRRQMVGIDAQLLVALEKRAKTSKALGALLGEQLSQLSLQDRPQIEALVARSTGDMPAESLRTIFRAVYAACLGLQTPTTVTYLGPKGAPGLSVASGHFGSAATFVACDSEALALEEVSRQRASFAVLPYETSTEGPVHSTILAVTASELRIAQVLESIPSLHLFSRTGSVRDIEKVYATTSDRVLAESTLATMGQRAVVHVESPLVACQMAAVEPDAGALADENTGAEVGLEIAYRNVLDRSHERARYAIVSSRPSSRTGDDSTAIVFTLADAPGVLLDALKKFAESGIDLRRIQSRPAEANGWAYLFFLEVKGHATDRQLVSALEEVKRLTKFFRVLGSYPAHG
jgi:chorismate mutase/prephenate dehydratase